MQAKPKSSIDGLNILKEPSLLGAKENLNQSKDPLNTSMTSTKSFKQFLHDRKNKSFVDESQPTSDRKNNKNSFNFNQAITKKNRIAEKLQTLKFKTPQEKLNETADITMDLLNDLEDEIQVPKNE